MKYDIFNTSTTVLSYLAQLLGIIIGIRAFKKISREFIPIFFLFVASVSADATSYILIHVFKKTNLWLGNIYTIVEFTCLSLFFLFVFNGIRKPSWITYFLPLSFVVVLLFIFYLPISTHTGEFAIATEAFVMICLSIYYLYEMLKKMEYDTPYMNPHFWVSAGILFYLAGNFFFFIFRDPKYQVPVLSKIHNVLHLIFVTLLFIGFWKELKKQT